MTGELNIVKLKIINFDGRSIKYYFILIYKENSCSKIFVLSVLRYKSRFSASKKTNNTKM